MSRVGKKEIIVPKDINVELGEEIKITKGKDVLIAKVPSELNFKKQDNKIIVERSSNDRKMRSMHGLFRNLINNMISGLKNPFTKTLTIKGIGYKAQVSGKNLVLNVGYSHPVEFLIPEGINISIENKTNQVIISGINKANVGEVAAQIRRVRPPEPYKGTGIMYTGERIKRKAGKAAASGKK
ncbi:50S ribosomal protein L6 [bacterium]